MKKDYKVIMEATQCTEKQAKYLAGELVKRPAIMGLVMNNLDVLNLFDACRITVENDEDDCNDWCTIYVVKRYYRPGISSIQTYIFDTRSL